MPAITLLDAEAQLATWLAASSAVASGQSYEIHGRRLTRVDAAEIRRSIDYWNAKVVDFTAVGAGRRSRSRVIVPAG